jgi:hypothetical protein
MSSSIVPQAFGTNIWIHDGPVIDGMAGFHFPTRMAILRLSGGDLFIWSPTDLTDPLRDWLAATGPVAHIVAPNALHHSFLAQWHAAFPQALIHPAPRLRDKYPDMPMQPDLTDTPPPAWANEIDQALIPNTIAPEIVFFHHASGTAIFTDLLQNMPGNWFTGWRRIVARLDLMTGAKPQVPRKFRLALRPRDQVRQAVGKVLKWPTSRVILAHGTPVLRDGQSFLHRAFSWLK